MRVPRLVPMVALFGLTACSGSAPDKDTDTGSPRVGCGNGVVEAGEACDDGAANADDAACTALCAVATCGDGLVHAGVEECDDGGSPRHDGCADDCTALVALSLPDLDISLSRYGRAVSAGDIDDDGDEDLLVGDEEAAYVWFGPLGPGLDAGKPDVTITNPKAKGTSSFGQAIAGVGDVDGDEIDDLWIGEPYFRDVARFAGAAFLVRGPLSAGAVSASGMPALFGDDERSKAGITVAAAGDVNGDGRQDLLMSTRGGTDVAAFLQYGPLDTQESVADADVLFAGDKTSATASGVGDLNGDGYDDVFVGGDDGRVFYGPIKPGTVDLVSADVTIQSPDGQMYAASAAGDVDGDGEPDLAVVELRSDGDAIYVFFGPLDGTEGPTTADVRIVREPLLDASRSDRVPSVAGPGDLDGDGTDDLVIGDARDDALGRATGAAYVLLGPLAGDVPLAGAAVKLTGGWEDQRAGANVAAAGDLTGDGVPDVIIGTDGFNAASGIYVLSGAQLRR